MCPESCLKLNEGRGVLECHRKCLKSCFFKNVDLQLWRVKKVQLTGNNFTQKGLHDLTRRLGDVEDKKVIMIMMEQSNHIKKYFILNLSH